MPDPYVINSAYRTLQVLLAFAAPPHRFSLAELVGSMEIEKGQLYRSLKTLEKAGFLSAGSDNRFALTPTVNRLSAAAASAHQGSVVEVARSFMDRLADETGESVNLFVLAGDRAVCVDSRESTHQVRLASPVGISAPLHAGAVPKAMLANLPTSAWDRVLQNLDSFPKYTAATELNAERLRAELVATRERGYSISDEDYDASARGVGAAVFDASLEVIAGLSVGGPSFRVDDATLHRFGELVSQVARALSKALGYPG